MSNDPENEGTPPSKWPRLGDAVASDFGRPVSNPTGGTPGYIAGRATRPGMPGVTYPQPEAPTLSRQQRWRQYQASPDCHANYQSVDEPPPWFV